VWLHDPPTDLDVVVQNPRQTANGVMKILRKKKYKTKIRANPKWNSYVVMIQHGNRWKDAVDIQSDQLQRKFNAITQIRRDGTLGGIPKRELKDTVDAIATAEVLISSAEVRNAADDARIAKAKAALQIWKRHLRKLKGAKAKKAVAKRKPLNPAKKRKYVKYATKRLDVELDNIIFCSPTKLRVRSSNSVRKKKSIKKKKTKKK